MMKRILLNELGDIEVKQTFNKKIINWNLFINKIKLNNHKVLVI